MRTPTAISTASEGAQRSDGWVYSLLHRSYLFPWFDTTVWQPFSDWLRNITHRLPARLLGRWKDLRLSTIALRGAAIVVATWVSWQAIRGVIAGAATVWHHLPLDEFAHIVWLGVLTMSRVAAMTIIATLIWTPIGVVIGFHPKSGETSGYASRISHGRATPLLRLLHEWVARSV